MPPARRMNPYTGDLQRAAEDRYVFRSVRIHPHLWEQIEQIAAAELMSVNSLLNAMLELALDVSQGAEGEALLHARSQQWRTRYERKQSAKRLEKA